MASDSVKNFNKVSVNKRKRPDFLFYYYFINFHRSQFQLLSSYFIYYKLDRQGLLTEPWFWDFIIRSRQIPYNFYKH